MRLTMALLRMRIVRALEDMRSACRVWNLDAAREAELEMNEGLDVLSRRLRASQQVRAEMPYVD